MTADFSLFALRLRPILFVQGNFAVLLSLA
jgi:hypothetical protein